MPLRIGSLFSGYGGLDLAVEAFFGAETVWHSQYEPPDKKGREDTHQYAARILAHHWPDTPNLGDITAVDWDQVEPVDILTGGFPCTDVSLAGQRAGLNQQTRSGLWAHMARAIAALRPRLVVIENVRGLLSAPADSDVEPCTWCMGDGPDQPVLRALGAVLADLAGLGFDAEWLGLPASAVGAPHPRWREFILAWPAHPQGPRLEDRREGRPGRGVEAPADADQLGTHRPRPRRAGRHEPADHRQPAAHPDGDLVRHEPVTQPGSGSQALAELAGTAVAAHPGRSGQQPAEHHVQQGQPDAGGCTPADTEGNRRDQGRTEPARILRGSDPAVGDTPAWGVYEPAIRRWEHATGRPAPRPTDDQGRLAPAFVEWMMGLPAGWITGIPLPDGMTASQARNAQLKAGGNGVVPQQAYAALAELWRRATTPAVPAAA